MENYNLKYFLAANSCEGFVSLFNQCYNPTDEWRAYIIKGGPGTGKSSFMKFLTVKATEKNIKFIICPCSSDPNSLDAVIFPEKKVAVFDGTAPHIVEPLYPGICEEILNFGEFWDSKKLITNRNKILSLSNENKALHRTASRYIQAAGEFLSDNLKTAEACTDKASTLAFAKTLCKRYIPKHSGRAKEWSAFLGGITPNGVVSYSNTVLKQTENVVIINDEYGSVTNAVMNYIRSYALENGYEIITVKNAFLPSKLCDHIIIPELSLGFVREYSLQHFDSSARRIHARRFVKSANLSKSRERIRFNKKVAKHLLLSASALLAEAKATHDLLEKEYIKAMDFGALTNFANNIYKEILI